MKNDYRNSKGKADIASLTLPELQEYTAELAKKSGLKIEKFRAGQIFEWLTRGVYDFDEMTNLSAKLREVLRSDAYLTLPHVKVKLVSKIDGTVKYLFELADGECVESVFMRYEHGNTICISTQVGCRMGCTFCASTLGGLVRNLLPSEMLGQVIAAQNDTG